MSSALTLDAVPASIRRFLEDSIVPSPHSIDLAPSVDGDYLHRSERRHPHIAETYHLNSKLSPHSLVQPAGPEAIEQVREWFFETSYQTSEDVLDEDQTHYVQVEIDDLPEPVGAWVRALEPANRHFFGADLLMVVDGRLLRYVPGRSYLIVERSFSDEDHQALLGTLLRPRPDWTESVALAAVVVCPWRYQLLTGPRGYRDALFDVGRVLCAAERAADEADVDLDVRTRFYDRVAEDVLRLDGVERSACALLSIA